MQLQAQNVILRNLIDSFGLRRVDDRNFFPEWQENLPEITDQQKAFLDKVKAGYINLLDDPLLLEKTIQIAITRPILFLADLFLPPFHIKAEQSIEIVEEDKGVIIRGQLDILLLKEGFWLMVIESKRASFSIEAGLGQLLAYLFANPHPSQRNFGMISTGGSFIFVKLMKGKTLQYATSDLFSTRNQGNELYTVFRILKRISQL